ncbi:MAG: circadian clock protein KaiC [Zoogloea sp.]|nr:circadian clock protein KaiC [Zoogloea sp.]
MTRGGLPVARTTLVVGGTGTGKTVFALQCLVNGARQYGEPGIFVAFEENSRDIVANAASFGWDLPALERDKLFFLDVRISPDTVHAGGFDIAGMLAGLKAKADEIAARRIVFDSIDVLLALLDNPLAERQELYRLYDWLSTHGLTGVVTAGIGMDGGEQRYGFLQFMADCIVRLEHRIVDRVSLRKLRVMKYRGSKFAENESPLLIGDAGIQVADPGPVELEFPVSRERISSGVARLDTMLDGGYFRCSSVLVTGAPGTAKSTLCGAFVEAAAARGERGLYVSFDESANEIVRNLSSVNIQLARAVEAGLLTVYSIRTDTRSGEQHFMELRNLVHQHGPSCMVVDPLSAILKTGGSLVAIDIAQRLLYHVKSMGITLMHTSVLESSEDTDKTNLHISTIADTWIHLSYSVQAGERNRALSVVKSRGTHHSNQVRELILSDSGVSLSDVYTSGGEVLMGSMRWEKERLDLRDRERMHQELERRRSRFALSEAEAKAAIEARHRELEMQRAEIRELAEDYARLESQHEATREELGRLRGADPAGQE